MTNNKRQKKHSHMERTGRLLAIEEVMPHIVLPISYSNLDFDENIVEYILKTKEFNEKIVRLISLRLQTFKQHGTTCVNCGIRGQYFAVERCLHQGTFHLNLYGIDTDMDEVLFTKDHIVPKSRGGANSLSNMQTMCKPCNENKGNKLSYIDKNKNAC